MEDLYYVNVHPVYGDGDDYLPVSELEVPGVFYNEMIFGT